MIEVPVLAGSLVRVGVWARRERLGVPQVKEHASVPPYLRWIFGPRGALPLGS